jgi:hypothetical protein
VDIEKRSCKYRHNAALGVVTDVFNWPSKNWPTSPSVISTHTEFRICWYNLQLPVSSQNSSRKVWRAAPILRALINDSVNFYA